MNLSAAISASVYERASLHVVCAAIPAIEVSGASSSYLLPRLVKVEENMYLVWHLQLSQDTVAVQMFLEL